MERIGDVVLIIGACIAGLALFVLGYRVIRYSKLQGRWARDFWISVAIVLAFLSASVYGQSKDAANEQGAISSEQVGNKQEDSFVKLQKIWDGIGRTNNKDEFDKLCKDSNQLVQRILKGKRFTDAVKTTIRLVFNARTEYISHEKLMTTCYEVSPSNKYIKTMADLENQYVLLGKMYKEGKINQDVIDKSKTAVRNYYEGISEWITDKPLLEKLSLEEKREVVDFIVELCEIQVVDELSALVDKRVADVKKTREWRDLRKLFKEMVKYMPAELEVAGEVEQKLEKQLQSITEKINALKEEPTRLALVHMAQIATSVALHLSYSANSDVMLMCYDRKGLPPRKNSDYETQMNLLEWMQKEGKITKEVYDKVKQTIDRHEIDKEDPEAERGDYLADDLDHANTVLVFRLLRELYLPVDVRWEDVEPKLKEKINRLIKDLGADDWQVRESAQAALTEIGDPIVPALKEALEKTDQPEIKMRAKKILEELE
ncbi:MAG: hypothetical protein HY811_04930 [Planctomycetes bacterium]|nr:hypothetical protein [Planctomycetota bacterium]